MNSAFRIRDIAAERGTRQRGYLTVGETPMGPVQIPLVIVHGAKPGPTLCLTAGVHAAEFPAIDAFLRTVAGLDPADLCGALVAVVAAEPDQPEVHIRADEKTRYESIGRVVFACQRAAIAKISFVTEPPPKG